MGKVLIIRGADFEDVAIDKIVVDVEIPLILMNTNTNKVALSAAEGLRIFYTTDNSTPTTESNRYTSSFTINGTEQNPTVVKAITSNGTDVSSVPAITAYFSIDSSNNTTLALTSSVSGNIKYTTDGTTPSTSSSTYSESISIDSSVTIKVAIYDSGTLASEVATIQITE